MATYTREEFVKKYSPYVNTITQGTGLLTGTVMGQAILESSGNYNTGGQWRVGGSKLSQEANNYFGIKADPSWKGKVYNIKTREVVGGKDVYQKDDFRKYDSVQDSLQDHLNFLVSNPRYRKAGVFEAKTVAEQAAAIKRAGYATDPNYANTVSSVYDSIKGSISQTFETLKKESKEVAKKGAEAVKRNPIPTAIITVLLSVSVYLLVKTLRNK